jgi:serine/threonine protein kinase
VVKDLDMGLARFFNDDEDMLTKKYDENILGTADYLAPEIIKRQTTDHRVDIYALGIVAYELLVGEPPFTDRELDRLQAIITSMTPEERVLEGDTIRVVTTIGMITDAVELPYEVDPTLVRGLDYYTRTVFEFTSDALGAQSGVGGGGRYDGLIELLGQGWEESRDLLAP